MTPGEKLKDWRTGNKFSRKELADQLVNPKSGKAPHMSLIWCWETGKNPVPQWAIDQIKVLESPRFEAEKAPVVPVKETDFVPTASGTLSSAPLPSPNVPTSQTGHIVVEFGPEAKAFLGALIRAIVVDPDDIKDPIVRGFLKFSEGR